MLAPYKCANEQLDVRISTAHKITQNLALISGLLSSLVYAIADIVCSILYDGYSYTSQTVSELSAIDAPTRPVWNSFMLIYSLLMMLFAWGVWHSAGRNRIARIVAGVLFAYVVIGFFWPPMHQRQVIAAGGGTLTDTLHIAFTFITVPLMMLAIGFGATLFGRAFKLYSILTILLMLVFGYITSLDAPNLQANLPTPMIGIWERICIGLNLSWIIVLSIFFLIKTPETKGSTSNPNLS